MDEENKLKKEVSYHVKRKMKQKQIELIEGPEYIFKCQICGRTWNPVIEGRKRLPKGYWRCPEGCNEEMGKVVAARGLSVLLIDDDKPLNKTLAAILRNAGYRVVNVYTGAEAIEAYEGGSFDAVIVDIRLTDTNGIELLRKFREADPVLGTLMLSGAATLEDAVEALNHGADAFLLKPVEPADLLYRLGTVTGFKRLERELREARAKYDELFAIISK
jgi:CheY-like chemotaxis protein